MNLTIDPRGVRGGWDKLKFSVATRPASSELGIELEVAAVGDGATSKRWRTAVEYWCERHGQKLEFAPDSSENSFVKSKFVINLDPDIIFGMMKADLEANIESEFGWDFEHRAENAPPPESWEEKLNALIHRSRCLSR